MICMATAAKQLTQTGKSTTDARVIRKRFLALNHDRLAMARNALKKRQRIFVDLLPLLFHINHPALPGYVSDTTPAGIADYSVSKRMLKEAARLNKDFKYQRRAMHLYNIQALYMIGSSGTIAYNEKSDFDIWVCHRSELNREQVTLLNQKCDLISQWAAELGLEVTFFTMDVADFREGKTQALSNESSGSAQFNLLLEEFYRTGLLLAGKYPAWWLVPPTRAVDYYKHLQGLIRSRQITEYEFLDFGPLMEIPAGEFFGAALWQLNKAIVSPYKSILKLLLIESYASEYPEMTLLCTVYKQLVYAGNVNLQELDPYVLMCNKVEQYLLGIDEPERCELARRCFYFKANKKISTINPKHLTARTEQLLSLVRQWGWQDSLIAELDARANWKVDRVVAERNSLVKELTRSYRMLSEFVRTNATESYIDSEDLNLLGRRLYAAFERKTGKIELLNPGISANLAEERLSFVMRKNKGRTSWILYRHDYDFNTEFEPKPLKRCQSMIELVAWCHFNNLIGPQTLVTLHTNNQRSDSRELLSVIETFNQLFPDHKVEKADMLEFKNTVYLKSATLFINLGEDPLSRHTARGVHLTSNRSDALSYGGIWKNLANSVEMLTVDSWGEIFVSHFSGPNALMDCLLEYLNWSPPDEQRIPPLVKVFSFSSSRGSLIAKRVQQLYHDIVKVFYHAPVRELLQYVINIGAEYYLLKPENNLMTYHRTRNKAELIEALGQPRSRFNQVIFDRYAMQNSVLPVLFKHNLPNKVQIFFEHRDDKAEVWILDERGCLFHQSTEYFSRRSLLEPYIKFLSTAILRFNATEFTNNPEKTISQEIGCFQILRKRNGSHALKKIETELSDTASDYFNIQVIGDISGGPDAVFSLFCDGREFSSLEYGEEVLTEVARYVLEHRESTEKYPIYITDIEVSRLFTQQKDIPHLQTSICLNYKKAIEYKLNQALKNL